jgi:hypothetical protein
MSSKFDTFILDCAVFVAIVALSVAIIDDKIPISALRAISLLCMVIFGFHYFARVLLGLGWSIWIFFDTLGTGLRRKQSDKSDKRSPSPTPTLKENKSTSEVKPVSSTSSDRSPFSITNDKLKGLDEL